MSKWENLFNGMMEEIKFSTSNPNSFEEKWSFTSSRIRILSLIAILLLFFGVLFTFFMLWGPFSSFFIQNDRTIERRDLEKQLVTIKQLEQQVVEQETFIANMQNVILGKIEPADLKNKKKINPIDVKNVKSGISENEKELSSKVKEDLRTVNKDVKSGFKSFFQLPITGGVVSQNFDPIIHPALDIVAKKDEVVKVCAGGVVIYEGYTKNDGNFMIVDHGNMYISVYKHNKVNLKKKGQRILSGDAIGIVGNTGENSTGPHLHFELWYQQKPIDPQSIMTF
jgi:murein DD-endopeptidase MepM/ murein hydrolase activator NlpD